MRSERRPAHGGQELGDVADAMRALSPLSEVHSADAALGLPGDDLAWTVRRAGDDPGFPLVASVSNQQDGCARSSVRPQAVNATPRPVLRMVS
jgi:hypothetical protein